MHRLSQPLAAVATLLLALGGALPSGTARAADTPGRSVTIEWVGDTALSTQRGLPPGGLQRALGPVRGLLRIEPNGVFGALS